MEEPKLNIEDTITITYKGETYTEEDLDVIYEIVAENYHKNKKHNQKEVVNFEPEAILSEQKLKELSDWKTKMAASSWKSRQRSLRKKGRLEQYKIDSLNKLGMVWNPREDEWEKTYLLYRKFGLCDEIEEWVKEQRNLYKSKELPTENLHRLQAVNFPFEAKENEHFAFTFNSINKLKEKFWKKKRKIELRLINNPPDKLNRYQKLILKKAEQNKPEMETERHRKLARLAHKHHTLKYNFEKELLNLGYQEANEIIESIVKGKSMYYESYNLFFIEIFKSGIFKHQTNPYESSFRENQTNKTNLVNIRKYEELSNFNRAKIDPEIRKIACNYMLNYFEDIVDNNLKSFPALKYLISTYKKEKNIDQLLRLKKYIEQYPILNELYQDKIEQNLIKIKP